MNPRSTTRCLDRRAVDLRPRATARPGLATAARLAATLVALAPSTGCFPNFAEIERLRTEDHRRQMAVETDPELRAFLQGWYDCRVVGLQSHETSVKSMNCLADSEDRLVAGLESKARSARSAGAKAAHERAAACVKAAPRIGDFKDQRYAGNYAPVKACLEEKKRAVAADAQAEADVFAAAERAASPEAWLDFLARHRDHERAGEAAKHVVAATLRAEGDARAALEERLATAYPAAVAWLPAERRVLLVGPSGLRVRDLAKLAEAKVATNVVVARVRASAEPYERFDADELAALRRIGLADDVVAAMIEVTTKLEERKRADAERDALRAEVAALRAMIEQKQATGGGKGGQTVQTKDGPMDVLESCAKRLGAMKLCEQIPFPGSMICKGTAESSFPCPGS